VSALLAEVARAQEAAAVAKATRATAPLTTETSTLEDVVTWDSIALRVRDEEDQAALAEREALERVSTVEGENVTVLASAHEDAEGFI
jgi:flagellar basal body-associated protein FliL